MSKTPRENIPNIVKTKKRSAQTSKEYIHHKSTRNTSAILASRDAARNADGWRDFGAHQLDRVRTISSNVTVGGNGSGGVGP